MKNHNQLGTILALPATIMACAGTAKADGHVPNKQHRRNRMKFNKWTLGLAAVGVVSLASAARADEAKMCVVQTALSSTTLSGYVDTAAIWRPGTDSGPLNTAGNIPRSEERRVGKESRSR